ncbi:MAG: SAM-dependent methyltransferase [Thermoplasmata archaeon]
MERGPARLSAEELDRSRRVVELLRVAADRSGFLPFDRFMELALYAPEVGYYERTGSPLGSGGDFYTAAHVHPLFAASVAERVRAVRAALGRTDRFLLVELGPGDGTLAAGIAASWAHDKEGVEYVLVDRSAARGAEAEARLRAGGSGIATRTASSVGAIGPFSGVVLANEFLDAQPARRVRGRDGRWRELGVEVRDGRVVPAERELVRPIPGPPLPAAPPDRDLTLEVTPGGEGTVREIADHLLAGTAILLDYGFEESELVRGHADGTVAAVRGHRFLPDPLDAPGTADLSVFVNFTRVRAVATTSGLAEVAFRSQAETLGAWGFAPLRDAALRAAPTAEAKVRVQMASKNLLFGFERFRVLEVAPAGSADRLRASPT